MFDDPGRELKRLEDALLETPGQEDLPEWDDEDELDLEALLEDRPSVRRSRPENTGRGIYEDASDESAAVPDNDPRPKGIGGLVLLSILELAGIVAIALWWAIWLL